jgi:hypothetical protein
VLRLAGGISPPLDAMGFTGTFEPARGAEQPMGGMFFSGLFPHAGQEWLTGQASAKKNLGNLGLSPAQLPHYLRLAGGEGRLRALQQNTLSSVQPMQQGH